MDLILKKECIEILKKPLGNLINPDNLLESIKGKEIITVGDKVTQTALELGFKPKLSIIDYKIERKEITCNYKDLFENILKSDNEAGGISENAVKEIKESVKYNNTLLEIEGEEDLLVLPVVLEYERGVVLYGQPGEGIVMLEINPEKKEEIRKLYFNCFRDKL
ncbi:MAG: DUF359 domain-containing protein [Candidatus Aenigmatarchaeota archaeon]|nr:MAG: DUF359 domain-containing protein [Candidatus Aenigmarchaeota archaeon]